MNEEIRCITSKGKTAKNESEIDNSDVLGASFSVYQKIRTDNSFSMILTR